MIKISIKYSSFLKKNVIINDKFGIDEKYTFEISEFVEIYNYFRIIINNKSYKTLDALADILKVEKSFLIKEVKRLEKYNAVIFENKIVLNAAAKIRFNEFIEKNFPGFKRYIYYDFDYLEYYSLSFNKEEIYLRKVFDELGIDFEEYMEKVFNDNNLEKPSVAYLGKNIIFNNIKDFTNFVILSGKDLFDKIEQWSIINKMKGV